MSQLQWYLESVLPAPHLIAGQRLHPLCIGHALLLHRLGSPFAWDLPSVREPALGDLLLALAICRCKPTVARRRLQSRWHARRLRWLGWWLAHVSARVKDSWVAGLQDYLLYHRRLPDWWCEQKGGRAPGAPYLLQVELLMAGHGLDADARFDMPLRLASALYVAELEQAGAIKLVNRVEETAREAAAKLKREIEENGGWPATPKSNQSVERPPRPAAEEPGKTPPQTLSAEVLEADNPQP